MKVFVGMETSGMVRRAFQSRGHYAISCDLLPASDLHAPGGHHWQGDVFDVWQQLADQGMTFDLAIFHPDCTYLTNSAAWAYGDGPYHQKVKPGTLVGQARREARDKAVETVKRIWALPVKRKAVENPIGALSTRWRKPSQIIQPNQFGDDASKATCLWLDELPPLVPTKQIAPRMVDGRPRWANQTDGGQNRLSPSEDRWQKRAETFPGIAAAFADQWGSEHVAGQIRGW